MVTIDYNDFTKKGLKSLLQKFEKGGATVTEVSADNKQKREAGFAIKQATLTFESGQILVLKVKASGDLYQARLNGKVLAIKEYHKADTFTDEVLAYVKSNEVAYKKNKEKQLSRTRVAVPKPKVVSTTIAEQVAAFTASVEEFRGQNEAITAQLAVLQPQVVEKDGVLLRIQAQLEEENNRSSELQKQLDALKGGIMESAYFPKAGSPEYVVQKAGFAMVQDGGRILGFRDFGKTGRMVPVADYKKIPKDVLKAMKAVIQDDLDYEDEDGNHPFTLDAPLKPIFEAAGAAPAQIDRLQIANDMMHGDGRHPKLKAAFIDGFNNSCSIEDAITFIESFSDEELLTLLKSEENIFEGVVLVVGDEHRVVDTKEAFMAFIGAPADAPILEAVEGFNAFQSEHGHDAKVVIMECADCANPAPGGTAALNSEINAIPDQRGTYALRSEVTGWNVFQDTTVITPYAYPAPVVATSAGRGECPKCAGEMEPYGTGQMCASCGFITGVDSLIVESGAKVTLKGHRKEGDALAGKEGIILEAVPTIQGPYYKVEVDGLIYRGVPADMVLEGIGLDIDRSGTHDPNDPQHVDDPDHENYGEKKKPCPWCGSDVQEEVCINCHRQYPMAVKDREAWIAVNKPLPADDFPEQYE